MSNLRNLLKQANAGMTRTSESSMKSEDMLDDLEQSIDNIATTSIEQDYNAGMSKDDNFLSVGDPVVGIHRGQRMSGQVVAINGEKATVEWKDKEMTNVKTNTLELSNVDDDYEEQTMYIEAQDNKVNMGFDRESFNEDGDLQALLSGDASGNSTGFKYGGGTDGLL